MAIVMMRHLISRGLVDLRGIVATLAPAYERARLIRGTLDMLGMHDVPVGVGSDGGCSSHETDSFYSSYLPPIYSEAALALEPGSELLRRLMLEAAEGPEEGRLTLLLLASTKDAAILLRDDEALFVRAVREVVIMGGCKPGEWLDGPRLGAPPPPDGGQGSAFFATVSSNCEGSAWYCRGGGRRAAAVDEAEGALHMMEPDSAANNAFDMAAARFLYRRCQELGVRLVVLTRYAAYAAKVDRSIYDEIASAGSCIGWRLRNEQRTKLELLWARANATDDEGRQGLPARCTREWFLAQFCDAKGARRGAARKADDAIWDLVDGFFQYDTVALLASIPAFRRRFFRPVSVRGEHGTCHLVIGTSDEENGVVEPPALVQEMRGGFADGIACQMRSLRLSLSRVTHVILLTRPRSDHALIDLKLCCAMLRSLWGLGVMACNGILVEVTTATEAAAVHGFASRLRQILSALGLSHVPVRPVDAAAGRSPRGFSRSRSSSTPLRSERWRMLAATARGVATSASLDAALPARGAGDGGSAAAPEAAEEESLEPVGKVLLRLYHTAPPAGITLVSVASLASVAQFAERHTTLFRERTSRIVHMADTTGRGAGAGVVSARLVLLAEAAASQAAARANAELAAAESQSVHGSHTAQARRRSSSPSAAAQLATFAPDVSAITGSSPSSPHHERLASPPPQRSILRSASAPSLLRPDAITSHVIPPSYSAAGRPPAQLPPSDAAATAEHHPHYRRVEWAPGTAGVHDDIDAAEAASARRVYELAQSFSVPLVALSSRLGLSCRVPRELLDALADFGGAVGVALRDEQRLAMDELWAIVQLPADDARRGGLPGRYDERWFRRTHCDPEPDPAPRVAPKSHRSVKRRSMGLARATTTPLEAGGSSRHEEGAGEFEYSWDQARWLTLHAPLALLAAHPVALERLFPACPVRVRSAVHHLVGVAPAELRSNEALSRELVLRQCLCQCLFSGCRQSASQFDLGLPSALPLGHGAAWAFEEQDDTLREVLFGQPDEPAAGGGGATPPQGGGSSSGASILGDAASARPSRDSAEVPRTLDAALQAAREDSRHRAGPSTLPRAERRRS